MSWNGDAGAVKRRLVDPAFLIFSAATILLTGLVVLLTWLTGAIWIAAFVPVAPALVTFVMSFKRGETEALKNLLRSATNGQVGGRWFGVSSLLFPLIAVLAIIIYAITGDSDLNFSIPRVGLIFAALPVAMCNELGWRGYAPVHISNRKGLFVKSIIIAIVWVVSLSPVFFIRTMVPGGIPLLQLALAFIALSTLAFWLIANTKSILMAAVLHASGLMAIALLPILPGDAGQGVTLWLIVGFLWIAAVLVVGRYGTDGLDGSIHELPPEELPVDWEKIMPRSRSDKKRSFSPLNGRATSKPKSFSSVGRKSRR